MRNTFKKIITLFLAVLLVFSLAACGKADDTAKYEELIDSFVPSKMNTFSLEIGEIHKPIAALWLQSGGGKVYSSDESVVTITKYGKVTAVGEGAAYIVIQSGSLSKVYGYYVTAEQPEVKPSFELDISYEEMIDKFVPTKLNDISLKIGDIHTPSAAIWLESDYGRAYSSDENVVTISKSGEVTAVGEGTAYIIITLLYNYEVYRYDVTAAG